MAKTETLAATAVEVSAADRKVHDANAAAADKVRRQHIARELTHQHERSNMLRTSRGLPAQSLSEFVDEHPEYSEGAIAGEEQPLVAVGATSSKKRTSSKKATSSKKRTSKK